MHLMWKIDLGDQNLSLNKSLFAKLAFVENQ